MRYLPFVLILPVLSCSSPKTGPTSPIRGENRPRIVNIINFIRLCEPRDEQITEQVLYETVVEQVRILKEYHLPGTFLLQYDALLDKHYQDLLTSLPDSQFEIGAWWEIPEPLVVNSGYAWRGRYPWDWHANVGFSTGYTPEERERLVDTYMRDFKKVFGYYPRSVGSWFIDEHTLNYLYEKYGIIASCNCKDQIGTDGYTLWGGYWSQAYYPSKKNSYIPAQDAENQIPVPVFRMLGSDPIHQYDAGLGLKTQHVVSLEPVYSGGGGNQDWCNWFFHELVTQPCLAFSYVQVGQENSFTWKAMEKGYRIQMPLIDQLRKEGKVVVQTLRESGEWFRKQYPTTPPTAMCALSDHSDRNLKTVWFNSRFYRANLLWEDGTLRFRDIHCFDEDIESDYLREKGTSTSCNFFTLPVVDGFRWSTPDQIAGLRFKVKEGNEPVKITGGDPVVDEPEPGILRVTWPVAKPSGEIIITFSEQTLTLKAKGKALKNWFLELSCCEGADLPEIRVSEKSVEYRYKSHPYALIAKSGTFQPGSAPLSVFEINPERNTIILDLLRPGENLN